MSGAVEGRRPLEGGGKEARGVAQAGLLAATLGGSRLCFSFFCPEPQGEGPLRVPACPVSGTRPCTLTLAHMCSVWHTVSAAAGRLPCSGVLAPLLTAPPALRLDAHPAPSASCVSHPAATPRRLQLRCPTWGAPASRLTAHPAHLVFTCPPHVGGTPVLWHA